MAGMVFVASLVAAPGVVIAQQPGDDLTLEPEPEATASALRDRVDDVAQASTATAAAAADIEELTEEDAQAPGGDAAATAGSDLEAAAEAASATAVTFEAESRSAAERSASAVDASGVPLPPVRPSITKKETLFTGEADPVADWAKSVLTPRDGRIESQAVTRKLYDSLYMGFGGSQASVEPEVTNEFRVLKSGSGSPRAFVGYAVRDWLAVEMFYADLGSVTIVRDMEAWRLAYKAKGILVNLTTAYPTFVQKPFQRWSGVDVNRRFRPYFQLGLGELDYAWDGPADALVDQSSSQLILGVGLITSFASKQLRWQVRLSYAQYGSDVGVLSVDWLMFGPGTGY